MGETFRPVTINFASVNVVGVPGLMLVLIALAIAVEFPEARWLVVAGVCAGAILAAVLVVVRRRRVLIGGRDPDMIDLATLIGAANGVPPRQR
jgi:hypothetical protein